jgi:hypothetical protein
MKIEIKILSKEALVDLVTALHQGRPFPDEVLVSLYRRDLSRQLRRIQRQFKRVEKQLGNKMPMKVYQALVKKYNALGDLGTKKIAILKELDNAAKE